MLFFLGSYSYHCLQYLCRVVSDLLAEVRGLVGCLYKLSEIISMLDLLVSLAHVATTSEYGTPLTCVTLMVQTELNSHTISNFLNIQ